MIEGRASITAQLVTFIRALESARPEGERLFRDPWAGRFLSPPLKALLDAAQWAPARRAITRICDRAAPGGVSSIVGRTRFIDGALADALEAGIDRVVILGAGFDCRAWRMASLGGVEVLEVDHPDTQREKQAALGPPPEAKLRFCAIDFTQQTLAEALKDALAPPKPTFFIWEGVLNYLPPEAVDATLAFVASAGPPGSRLAFTYVDKGFFDQRRKMAGRRVIRAITGGVGEPFKSGLDPATLDAFLARRGLRLVEDRGCGAHQAFYFGPLGRKHAHSPLYHVALATLQAPRPSR